MEVRFDGTFVGWQGIAREMLARGVAPGEIAWVEEGGQAGLFGGEKAADGTPAARDTAAAYATPDEPELADNPAKAGMPVLPKPMFRVPRRFVELARNVAAFRDAGKWRLLYSVLWRIAHENHHLLKIETDDEVIQLLRMEDAVSRDVHHFHAFVRFKKILDAEGERYVAWYKPDHKSIWLAAPFFAARFASMRWSILTPDGSAHWDAKELSFSEGMVTPPESADDGLEKLWSQYYATTFNPARTNLRMMRSEMPQRFWKHMPELADLPQILQRAPERVGEMMALQKKMPGAAVFVPANGNLKRMREAVQHCEGCELYKYATQAVFGEGPENARVMLIGEQPGDQEDRAGKPFVGPAGEVLNRALLEAGMDRSQVYVTNAVKHFAFEERGKRRIHRTPKLSEVTACRPWMEAELAEISAEIVVCLGATAAKAVFGPQFRLTEQRGKFLPTRFSEKTLATYHPSAVLRGDTPEAKDALYKMLLEDLQAVAKESAKELAAHSGKKKHKAHATGGTGSLF